MIYQLVYDVFFLCARRMKKKKENGRSSSILLKKVSERIEWYYNIWIKKCYEKNNLKSIGINTTPRREKIIVSLTSYPKRIETTWLAIETLLRQTVKPDKIILWLADTQFGSLEKIPRELREQQKRGLTIRFCDDLKSHKKYFYTMQEYKNDLIILVDDDIFYPYDTIEKLMKLHNKHPNDICTMTAQVMEPCFSTCPSKWRNPKLKEKFEHSDKIQIFTGSGSLYPPNALHENAFDKKVMQKLCPFADDMWLTFMAYRNHTKITAQFPWRAFPVMIYGTGKESLYYINAEDGQNDVQWTNMLKYFDKK